MATTMALKKEVVMVHNLQLLGFETETEAPPPLHPHIFNRPNEKTLFLVLHFLLLKLNPQIEQELRFCWPIVTPHDKSNFKRLAQSVLQDLEKRGIIPLGSSHASRLNAGSGPRIVDLIWRLSTHAMKEVLANRRESYHFASMPLRSGADAADAIQLLKVRIAMKTRQLQEQFAERSEVQDRWVSSAVALTNKIHETTILLREVYEQQSQLDASINREMYSQAGETRRETKLTNTAASWSAIDNVLGSTSYQASQRVLDTTLQHHGDQPVLDARNLYPQRSFSDRIGAVNLSEVVKNADALLQLTRSRLAEQDSSLHLSSHDQHRMTALARESNVYVATLTTTLQHLRDVLRQLKEANESSTRELCIKMTTESVHRDPVSIPWILCPPTPADKMLQESDLVQSLKKCTMNELSSIAAGSVRKSTRRKSLELQSLLEDSEQTSAAQNQSKDELRVFRKLRYDFDEDGGDHMEI